jgi:asparagine synthase (glutamine-hydrolysing)
MAHSLEVRSPFLDHTLMEWAATIPDGQKLPGTELKALLKRAMAPYLPPEVLDRPKRGFVVPLSAWLGGDLRDFSREHLLSGPGARRGLFDRAAVARLLDEPAAAGSAAPPGHNTATLPVEHQARRIWALLMLELWFQMWIDTDDAFRHPAAARLGTRPVRRGPPRPA